MKMKFGVLSLVAVAGLFGTNHVEAQSVSKPILVASGKISGTLADKSGREDKLKDGTPCNQFGGISGLEYSGEGDEYFAIGDRGPKDGAVDWDCRFHRLSIVWSSSGKVTTKILKTSPMKDDKGRKFVGVASAFKANKKHSYRLDPEGIRTLEDGNLLVSDEYGPHLLSFSRSGKQQKKFDIPSHYLIKNPGLDKDDENPQNNSGRQCNRGFEGVTLSADRKWIVLVVQSPLIQDCDEKGIEKPVGKHIRLLWIHRESGKTKEMVYVLDHPKNVINEIIALDDHQFLLIERDGKKGSGSKYKKVVKIDTESASDVSGIKSLAGDLPSDVTPVKKSMFIDLLDPSYKLAGEDFPKKIEGLALGPKFENGKQTLVIASDNDFKSNNPSWIYVFEF